MGALVVRLAEVERAAEREGRFADAALGGRALPGFLSRWFALACVDTAEPRVALSYDDGPNPRDTPRLLDLLRERGATATFFVLAIHAQRHPDLIRRIVAEGHELALHGIDHTSLATLGAVEGVRRVRRARRRVEAIAGVRVRRYRPPYGEYTPWQAFGIRLAGLDLVIWSGDAVDWRDDRVESVVERAAAALHPGGILLLHDERADPETAGTGAEVPRFDRVEVLAGVLDRLAERGLTTATIGALSAAGTPVRSLARYRRHG